MKLLTKIILVLFIIVSLPQYLSRFNPAYAFSVGDEKKVGEELHTMVRKEFRLIDEPDIIQYINELGNSTLEVAGSQYFDYHFFVINNKELNAFAAPSGLIFFHSGLIETLENEGELVGVIAHEIGHVVSRHLADRIKKTSRISAATMLGVLVGIAIGGGPLSEAIIAGSAAAGQTAALSFSRLDEEEADRLAFKWMQDQNRNPSVMVDMLRKIHNINRYRQGNIPPYLLTHPGPDIRMGYIQDLILFTEKKPYVQFDDFPFQRFKSRIISMTKDPMQLISNYRNAVLSMEQESSEAAMAHYILSQAYLAAADYVNALKELQKTISIYPERVILKTDLGVIYLKSGNYKMAITQLQEARKAGDNSAYTIFNLAMALEKTGQLQEAAEYYEELLPQMSDYSKLYYQLARVKAALGLEGEGFYYYGYYYLYEGNLERAEAHFTKAVSLMAADNQMKAEAERMLKKIKGFKTEG
ncbi:MAG: M48 family metalloprotease [Deltaproteobacteria bacterium]|nr:M48 family metalloprotease [Deltaproteobacteria bacterium]